MGRGTMNSVIQNWWTMDVMPFYYAHAPWIKFCVILFIILEVLNFSVAFGFRLYLKQCSPIYKNIKRINKKYSFNKVARQYTFSPHFNSVEQMRNFDPRIYATKELKYSNSKFTQCVTAARINRKRYQQYIHDLRDIDAEYVSSRWGRIASFFLLNYEKEIYHRLQLEPVMNPTYFFKLRYSSPAGRNNYSSSCTVEQSFFERVYDSLYPSRIQTLSFNKTNNKPYTSFGAPQVTPKKRVSAVYATEKPIPITPGLRQEVMHRDKYSCTLCRRDVGDGIQLEVMPIRNSAPLEKYNLHTICNECFSEEQRRLATSALKKKILERDNYTCRRCGHRQADGYQLHVDHIRPIKKWGLSTEENLWTLCATCNLGKGTKYDPQIDYLH